MGLRVFVYQCAFIVASISVFSLWAYGQDRHPIPKQLTTNRQEPQRFNGNLGLVQQGTKLSGQTGIHDHESYRLSSRIHLQRGANVGYLVVRVELKKNGSHIYSLTQAGDIPPTKIKISPSRQFQLTGKFSADTPPSVTEHDPIMMQRIEKHVGVVQFFAPIKIAAGVKPSTLIANATFDGQVCTEDNLCMPISGIKLVGKFSGYFDRTAVKRKKTQKSTPR